MKKRRPEQLSMLTLMGGSPPERKEPFHGSIITLMEYDDIGNITRLTVEGAGYVEETRLATKTPKVVAQAAGCPAVDKPTQAVALEGHTTDEENDADTPFY